MDKLGKVPQKAEPVLFGLPHLKPFEIITYLQIGFGNPNVGVDLIDLASSRGDQPEMWSNPPLFSKWQRIAPIPVTGIIP
jgi:hypothetical protein